MNSPILTFLGETPPTFTAQGGAGSIEHVYVPANAVDTYKATPMLVYVKDLIEAIPDD